MPPIIRPAHARDSAALAEIYRDGRRQAFGWCDPATFRLDDFAADAQGEAIWLAQAADGTIAGFISVWAADDFIHMLYVREAWQRRGVGTALLRALPGWPDRPYRLKCLVANARARRFYEAHGFVAVGRGASPEGDYDELRAGAPR
ncbi:MAG: GNAT family N-acetyltransferase [Pseudomonadota bacterium]|jgi:GNAT superfamily N-acetyltransferase